MILVQVNRKRIASLAASFALCASSSLGSASCRVPPKRADGKPLIVLDCRGTRFASPFCTTLQSFINDTPANSIDTTDNQLAVKYDSLSNLSERPVPVLQALALESASLNVAQAYANALAAWEASRLDKQSGAVPSSTASTALVSQPGASGLLSLALETGGFTDSINGTSMTLNGNVGNAYELLTTGNPFPNVILASNCQNPLQSTNIAATFTLDQSSSTTTATTGAANSSTQNISSVILPTSSAKLNSFSVRWNYLHSLDPTGKTFQDAWTKAATTQLPDMQAAGAAFSTAAEALIDATAMGDDGDATFKELTDKYTPLLIADYASQNGKQLVQDFDHYLQQYFAHARENDPKDFDATVVAAVGALATYAQLNQQVINSARGVPILTAQYTFSRPSNQPATHDFTMIFAESWRTGGQLTANGAASIYNSVPAGAAYGRLKDLQVSAELDQSIGDKTSPPLTFSLAGYGQYQFDPSVLNITSANLAPGTNISLPANAQVLLGTSGWLGIVQAKLTLNLQKSISIPLAIKWSNKTDLLQAQDVRGQVGISYDFSSLLKQ